MIGYLRSGVSDHLLEPSLAGRCATVCRETGQLLADLAEFDARRLQMPVGYPSLFAYCVGHLGMTEDVAGQRIQAARAAREFPLLFDAVAQGALHLSAVRLLAPHLTRENAPEFVKVASVPPAPCAPVAAPARVTPLAPQRYALQVTLDQDAHDFLRHAQDLMGRGTPGSEVGAVLKRALELYMRHLEQKRFAATDHPGRSRRSNDPRRIPAEVRRRVWQRDQGRCTFRSDAGHRCEATSHLEFDHVEPVARGGGSTPSNLRPRCRAHNPLDAERVHGVAFMNGKRQAARAPGSAAYVASGSALVRESRSEGPSPARARTSRPPSATSSASLPRPL